MSLAYLIILGIATYRLSILLADEDGPYELIERFRYKIGVRYDERSIRYGLNVFSRGIICTWCNSVWIGFFFTLLWAFTPAAIYVALPFALSGIAVFMVRNG